jgi:tetratricopeptide (TPR) repeat protein
VSASLALALLLALAPDAAGAQVPVPVPPGPTFEELWGRYVRADAGADAAGAEAALRDLRRARVERNVASLDTIGLALVERGAARLAEGRREEAEEAFRRAVELAPGLPDAHAGLSRALLKKGPLGVVPSLRAALHGASAFLATGRGGLRSRDLATVAFLLAAFGVAWGGAVALLLRRGGLLRHDLEEWLGPGQSRAASLALFLLLLLLPVATFQGWGWLPPWWLALLFPYLSRGERSLAVLLLGAAIAAGPLVASLEARQRTARNPLLHAALRAVETVPDSVDVRRLAEAAGSDPADRDLAYLLATARRKSGRYDEAAALYRGELARDPSDAVARNNLANLEFARGGFDVARERYREGTAPGNPPEVAATSFYNLSLVHLQKFEYQAYNEAKSNADRLAPGLVADYDRWRYDSGDYAVVDMGLDTAQVARKFAGAAGGAGARNVIAGQESPPAGEGVARALANRFSAALGVFALVAFAVGRWRGPKAFTLHCARCGTAFCRSCHLGQVSGGLCSQCYHMFVVRDGVSAPARNRKMAAVQAAEARRERVFRALSVLSPGAGQVYGGWTLRGTVLMLVWYGTLGVLLGSWRVPFVEVSGAISPPWGAIGAGGVLLLAWVAANRFRPAAEVGLPARPSGQRRARAPQAAG